MVKVHYNANFITINLYRNKYTSVRFAIKLLSIITYQFYPCQVPQLSERSIKPAFAHYSTL